MALAALVSAGEALAASATGTAEGESVTPIAIAANANLKLGQFSSPAGDGGGTITIGTDGSPSKTGGVVLVTGSGAQAATFDVTGQGNLTYAITLPGDATVTLSNGGGGSIALNSFVSDPANTGQLTGGAQTLNVGATATIADAQEEGTYTGTFDVTVEYN